MKTVKVTNKCTGEIQHLIPSPRRGSLLDLGNWGGAFQREVTRVVTNKKDYHCAARQHLLDSAPKAAISSIYNSNYCKG